MENKLEYKNGIVQRFKTKNPKENNKWETYCDKLNTVLFDKENVEISRKDIIDLEDNEFPLLECNLPNGNYFLMTTEKVYSYFRNYLQERSYDNLEGLHTSTFFFNDPKLGNKTEFFVIQCKNKSLLFYEIDGGQPGYYVEEMFRAILGNFGIIR